MVKKLIICSLATIGLFMTGCLTDPLQSAAPTITGPNTTDTLAANSPKIATIKIEADDAITTWSGVMLNSAGTTAAGITATPSITVNNEKSKTIVYTITATTATAGAYTLEISATAGGLSSKVDFSFVVKGTVVVTTPVTETTVALGAQGSTLPSLLDADDMIAYSSTIADAATQAKIDVIFSYSTVLAVDALAFTSPSVAAGTPYSNWITKASTEFKVVTATWASITTQEQIDALWGTVAGSTRLTVAQGNVIAVKTSAGKYKLIQITTLTGTGTTATLSIKGLH
jgi:hypothetical protein